MPFPQVRRDPAFREYSSSFCGTCVGSNSLDSRTELSAGLQAPRRPVRSVPPVYSSLQSLTLTYHVLPDLLSIPCSQGLSCKATPTGVNVSLEEGAMVEPLSVAVQSVGRING
ncbi:hypothetical protein BT69DRAFT_1277520 [Atractiella rhizophila]|nr:hypothetical protein BT69DRAFT_1277520 [Atractiella rhizophila]